MCACVVLWVAAGLGQGCMRAPRLHLCAAFIPCAHSFVPAAGATQVVNLELLSKPPETRAPNNPWPYYPR